MQSAWANAYEALADVLGRGIRYGEAPTVELPEAQDMVRRLQQISTHNVVSIERRRQRLATRQLETGLTDEWLRTRGSRMSQAAAASIKKQWDDLQRDEASFVSMLNEIESLMRAATR